jgi:replicative DNA helicase
MTTKVWDKDAERAVLGAILINEDECWAEGVHTTVAPEDFFSDVYRATYKAMLSLRAKHEPVTSITIAGELELAGVREWMDKQVGPHLETVGALMTLAQWTYASYGVIAHARMVKDYSDRRRVYQQAQEMVQRADSVPVAAVRYGREIAL